MRKLFLVLFLSILSTTFAQIRYLSFTDGYVNERNFKAASKEITTYDDYTEVSYTFDGAYLKQVESKNDNAYLRLYMDNAFYNSTNSTEDDATYKHLPYFKDIVVLPENAKYKSVKVEIAEVKYQDFQCPFKESEKSIISNDKNYNTVVNDKNKEFFPGNIITCVAKSTFRNVPFTTINTFPVFFDIKTNTLRCYSTIKYRITYDKHTTSKPVMTKLAYNLLGRISSNPKILNDYDKTLLNSESECGYLIVTTEKYKSAAEKLASWKLRLGYKCHILSRPNWDGNYVEYTADAIRAYCDSLNQQPDYLLIIGSSLDVPSAALQSHDSNAKFDQTGPTWFSDTYLGKFKNSSNLNDDIVRARISVYSPEEAISVVDKIISYEQNPPTDSEFYHNSLSIGLFDSDDKIRESKTYDFLSTAEGTSRDLETLGYEVDRHYINYAKGTPQYFLNGDRMPDYMYMTEEGNDFWDKDVSHITNLLNKGKSIVIYNGHGNEGAYSNNVYTQKEVAKLENADKTPVFFNFACSTGAFYYVGKDSLCFAESLLNKANGGAVGVYANTRRILTNESKIMGSHILRALFNNSDISIATAVLQATFSVEFDYTHQLAQYFGDPSMKLWTVVPAKFKPFINKSGSTITVNSYVAGSKVTICSIADWGETYYKSVELSNDTKATFEGVNVPCYITITKNNYVPFMTVSKDDLYLQNMSLNRYHDIVATNITTGSNITEDLAKGDFIVESGTAKLRGEKSITLKSGTSVKNGASLIVRKGADDSYNYKGNGIDRRSDIPLCFNTLTDRFTTNEQQAYNGGNYGNGHTSIQDKSSEEKSIVIYPNPTSGNLNIIAKNGIQIEEVTVMDMTGNTLMSESANSNNASLDLSTLGKGMYLVKVITADESIVKKVVLK